MLLALGLGLIRILGPVFGPLLGLASICLLVFVLVRWVRYRRGLAACRAVAAVFAADYPDYELRHAEVCAEDAAHYVIKVCFKDYLRLVNLKRLKLFEVSKLVYEDVWEFKGAEAKRFRSTAG